MSIMQSGKTISKISSFWTQNFKEHMCFQHQIYSSGLIKTKIYHYTVHFSLLFQISIYYKIFFSVLIMITTSVTYFYLLGFPYTYLLKYFYLYESFLPIEDHLLFSYHDLCFLFMFSLTIHIF